MPTGIVTGANMDFFGNGSTSQYNQSFQWSVINMSTTIGDITIVQSAGHRYVGNTTLFTIASYRFLTVYTALNTCITYRGCN